MLCQGDFIFFSFYFKYKDSKKVFKKKFFLFRFSLHLSTGMSCATSQSNLEIVETNPFKHLVHLSLKFFPAKNEELKNYLVNCLKKVKVKFSCVKSAYITICALSIKCSEYKVFFYNLGRECAVAE